MKRNSSFEEENEKTKHIKDKMKKIEVKDSQINLSSLNKLALDNTNLKSKFNPKLLYAVDDEDRIYMKEYMDSPIKTKYHHVTNLMTKASQKSVFEKDKSSQSFL